MAPYGLALGFELVASGAQGAGGRTGGSRRGKAGGAQGTGRSSLGKARGAFADVPCPRRTPFPGPHVGLVVCRLALRPNTAAGMRLTISRSSSHTPYARSLVRFNTPPPPHPPPGRRHASDHQPRCGHCQGAGRGLAAQGEDGV